MYRIMYLEKVPSKMVKHIFLSQYVLSLTPVSCIYCCYLVTSYWVVNKYVPQENAYCEKGNMLISGNTHLPITKQSTLHVKCVVMRGKNLWHLSLLKGICFLNMCYVCTWPSEESKLQSGRKTLLDASTPVIKFFLLAIYSIFSAKQEGM